MLIICPLIVRNICYKSNIPEKLNICRTIEHMPYDRTQPFNNLPFLPPVKNMEEDVEVMKKLVTASRACIQNIA